MSLATAATGRVPLSSSRAAVLIAAAALLALHGVLNHGFLIVTFDDGPFVSENPLLVPWTWSAAWACVSQFYFHDYLPLPLLSYLVEFQLWGLWPVGYHATNLALHIWTSILVALCCRRALESRVGATWPPADAASAGLWAGMVFALHPVQLEVVSLVAQRKSVLAVLFVMAALLSYQRALRGERGRLAISVLWYACACASKSSVVPFPFLLVLYDRYLGERPVRLLDKLPFLLLALITALLSVLSKADVAIKPPQGGSYLSTALAMSRVAWEYVAALLVPVGLSPSYYYAPQAVFSAWNFAALAGICVAAGALFLLRQRLPLTTFSAAWVAISLLPVSNIVPIAVLRADRYLYLPMVGFALWAGAGLARAGMTTARGRAAGLRAAVPVVACAALGVSSWQYAAVWQDDVAAWTRVVQRHPWNSRAHYLLGIAQSDAGQWPSARLALETSTTIDPTFAEPHRLLADVYRQLGDAPTAAVHEQRWRELTAPRGGARP